MISEMKLILHAVLHIMSAPSSQTETDQTLRYPLGPCVYPETYTPAFQHTCIQAVRDFPAELSALLQSMQETHWQHRYRPGGWTIQQVVHHCADSHLNALIRIKFTLTEEQLTIKPYHEDRWAETADYKLPLTVPMQLLHAIHTKLLVLFENMTEADWQKQYYHSEYKRYFSLQDVLCLYAWHGRHHLAHIRQALHHPFFS